MSETEDELWGVIDHAIFGTNDPERITAKFKQAYENRLAKQSTFGGYLRLIRTDEHATTPEMALQAGVNRGVWQSWEANRSIPTETELREVCRRLELGQVATTRLLELRNRMPHTILTRLSRHEPDQLVASGAGLEESEIEWRKLPPEVQEPLSRWAKEQEYNFPEDFLRVLFELETAENQQRWVDEVLGKPDVE